MQFSMFQITTESKVFRYWGQTGEDSLAFLLLMSLCVLKLTTARKTSITFHEFYTEVESKTYLVVKCIDKLFILSTYQAGWEERTRREQSASLSKSQPMCCFVEFPRVVGVSDGWYLGMKFQAKCTSRKARLDNRQSIIDWKSSAVIQTSVASAWLTVFPGADIIQYQLHWMTYLYCTELTKREFEEKIWNSGKTEKCKSEVTVLFINNICRCRSTYIDLVSWLAGLGAGFQQYCSHILAV